MSARKKEETAATQKWCPEVKQRPYFTFMGDWYDAIKDLPEESQGRLYRALIEFGLKFIEPEFTDPTEVFCWKMLRNQALYGWKKHVAGKGSRKADDFLGDFPDDAKKPDGIDWKEDAF